MCCGVIVFALFVFIAIGALINKDNSQDNNHNRRSNNNNKNVLVRILLNERFHAGLALLMRLLYLNRFFFY